MQLADLMPDAAPQLGTDNPTLAEMAAYQGRLAQFFGDKLDQLAIVRNDALVHGSDDQLDAVEGLQAAVMRQMQRANARHIAARDAALAAA